MRAKQLSRATHPAKVKEADTKRTKQFQTIVLLKVATPLYEGGGRGKPVTEGRVGPFLKGLEETDEARAILRVFTRTNITLYRTT